jgi:hypothetical protein
MRHAAELTLQAGKWNFAAATRAFCRKLQLLSRDPSLPPIAVRGARQDSRKVWVAS